MVMKTYLIGENSFDIINDDEKYKILLDSFCIDLGYKIYIGDLLKRVYIFNKINIPINENLLLFETKKHNTGIYDFNIFMPEPNGYNDYPERYIQTLVVFKSYRKYVEWKLKH